MADTGPVVILDTIKGTSYLAIQAAMTNVQRHRMDVAKYSLQVLRDRVSDIVVFTEKDPAGRPLGKLGVRSGSGSELSQDELGLIASTAGGGELLDTIQGRNFQAIQSAMTVFRLQNRDLSRYKIQVVRDNEPIVVIFTGKDLPPGTRGYTPAQPGFEVALDPHDLHVLHSNFIR